MKPLSHFCFLEKLNNWRKMKLRRSFVCLILFGLIFTSCIQGVTGTSTHSSPPPILPMDTLIITTTPNKNTITITNTFAKVVDGKGVI
ncbi:MAG TPA: hypothetical protein VIJ25_01075 [Methylococcales bacterium]